MILKNAKRLLEANCLCDNCLGRQFASLGYGMTNRDRGRALKGLLLMEAHLKAEGRVGGGVRLLKKLTVNGQSEAARATLKKIGVEMAETPGLCDLCDGIFQRLDEIAQMVLERVKGFEFETFLVGAKIPAEVVEKEDALRARFEVRWGETIKGEFTREVGKILSTATTRPVDLKKPDMVVTINPFEGGVEVQATPLFISGRYRKLVSGIPHSRWLCPHCRGKGCDRCGGTGKTYPDSVEEIISEPILSSTKGSAAVLHLAEREGEGVKAPRGGRLFILEVKNPVLRRLDLKKVAGKISASRKVEAGGLAYSSREEVRMLKLGGFSGGGC